MVTASRFKALGCSIRRVIFRLWNRLRGRTPDGFMAPSLYDGIIEDAETGTIIGYFNATPERVKRLREAAKRAGLDVEIADCPTEPPPAQQPQEPVKEDR